MNHSRLSSSLKDYFRSWIRWFDADYIPEGAEKLRQTPKQVDWLRSLPFIILHLACFGVIWVGASPIAVCVAIGLYFIRMFAITGFLHRYFSHKTYTTTRGFQFVMAICTATAVQRGALWWAYTHRHHHKHSDEQDDKHSPVVDGFWWSHIGWIMSKNNFPTDYSKIPDLAKFPELVFLNRFDTLIPLILGLGLYVFGEWLRYVGFDTNGPQLLVWGIISTVVLFHGTACINSLAHVIGSRRFHTTDDESRNSFLLTLITLGEGWHNNHHRYQAATKQGFYWWEFDPTYYALKVISWTGLIWNLKGVPESVYLEADENLSTKASKRA